MVIFRPLGLPRLDVKGIYLRHQAKNKQLDEVITNQAQFTFSGKTTL